MKHLYAAPFIAVLLGACSSNAAGPQAFVIDNPTDAPVAVAIDGHAHQVPAHDARTVELQAGAHTLNTAAAGEVNFLVYARGQGGLINPTGSQYVIARALADEAAPAVSRFDAPADGVTVDGILFEGPYRSSTALIIDRSWRAGVHDPVLASADPAGHADAKIFAAGDFASYQETVSRQPSTYAYVVNPGMPVPSYDAAVAAGGLSALPAVFGADAGQLRHVYTAYVGTLAPGLHRHDDGTRLVYLQPAAVRYAAQRP